LLDKESRKSNWISACPSGQADIRRNVYAIKCVKGI
jgi:hypothetical protein